MFSWLFAQNPPHKDAALPERVTLPGLNIHSHSLKWALVKSAQGELSFRIWEKSNSKQWGPFSLTSNPKCWILKSVTHCELSIYMNKCRQNLSYVIINTFGKTQLIIFEMFLSARAKATALIGWPLVQTTATKVSLLFDVMASWNKIDWSTNCWDPINDSHCNELSFFLIIILQFPVYIFSLYLCLTCIS